MVQEKVAIIDLALSYLLFINNAPKECEVGISPSTTQLFAFGTRLSKGDLSGALCDELAALFVISILKKAKYISKNSSFRFTVENAITEYRSLYQEHGPTLKMLLETTAKNPAKDIVISYNIEVKEENSKPEAPKSTLRDIKVFEIPPNDAETFYAISVTGSITKCCQNAGSVK